jgi:mono/diheme cytochrome c family protein
MRRWILAPALALVLATAGSAPAAAEADGKALFEKNCMKCHGPDGSADTSAGKKMKTPAWGPDDFKADVAVKTVRENKKHRTVSKKVSDEELQAIAAYVATLGGS